MPERILAWAEKRGWRVIWREPAGDSLTYCPCCPPEVPGDG